MDGHRSGLNSDTDEFFTQNNILVIIFLAHTSYCKQPFDVGIASSFKSNLKDLFNTLEWGEKMGCIHKIMFIKEV